VWLALAFGFHLRLCSMDPAESASSRALVAGPWPAAKPRLAQPPRRFLAGGIAKTCSRGRLRARALAFQWVDESCGSSVVLGADRLASFAPADTSGTRDNRAGGLLLLPLLSPDLERQAREHADAPDTRPPASHGGPEHAGRRSDERAAWSDGRVNSAATGRCSTGEIGLGLLISGSSPRSTRMCSTASS